jgi:hypothetical protein
MTIECQAEDTINQFLVHFTHRALPVIPGHHLQLLRTSGNLSSLLQAMCGIPAFLLAEHKVLYVNPPARSTSLM